MSSEEQGSSARPPAQEDVLGEVMIPQRSLRQEQPAEEDPDLALAKMLQAQEQAWLAMAGQGSGVLENMPPGVAEPGAGPRGADNDSIDAEGEALTDEEMARRLQQEEELEFQQRLLALAGVGSPGAPGAIGEGPPDSEADEGDDYLDEAVDPDELTYEQLTALGEAVGTVSKGLAPEQIDALPQRAYFEVAGAAAGPEEQCPICRMEFEPEDEVKLLPLCGHYYHPDCVTEWLKNNKVCCICNKEVVEENKDTCQGTAGSGGAAGASAMSVGMPGANVLGERRQQ